MNVWLTECSTANNSDVSGRTCLLLVSLRILHIDQDLTTAGFKSLHGEHSWFQHLVAMRLNTCNMNIQIILRQIQDTSPKSNMRHCFGIKSKDGEHHVFILLLWVVQLHCYKAYQVRRLLLYLGKALWFWEELQASDSPWGTETGTSSPSAHPHLGPRSPQVQSPERQTDIN